MIYEVFKNFKFDSKITSLHPNNHTRRDYLKTIFTKELLEDVLIKNNIPANEFSLMCKEKGLNISAGSVIERANKLNIVTYGIKHQNSLKRVRDKYKNTCIKKYGKINALSRGTVCYYKRDKTVKERYNVDNIFQNKAIIKKSLITKIKKYGTAGRLSGFNKVSKIQKKIEKILKELNIEFKLEKAIFSKFNKHLQKIYSPVVDILLTNKNIVIEIYGDYWHGNPKIYRKEDLIRKFEGYTKVEDIWKFDDIRKKQIESFNYEVIILWEYDINNDIKHIKNYLHEKCKN